MQICPYCGKENKDEFGFCIKCGYELPDREEILERDIVYPKPARRRGINWATVMTAIVALALILILLFYFVLPPFFQMSPTSVEFTIDHTFILEKRWSPSPTVIAYTLDVPCPITISDSANNIYQEVKNVEHAESLEANFTLENRYGRDWMEWTGNLDTSNATSYPDMINATVTYDVVLSSIRWTVDAENSLKVSEVPTYWKETYTGDEWNLSVGGSLVDNDNDGKGDVMIQPSDPDIKSLAADTSGHSSNAFECVLQIYRYMVDNIRYSIPSEMEDDNAKYKGLPKHAVATLRDKYGDCDDQSFLFSSLLRAVGVPAWPELGALYNTATGKWMGHSWTQIFIPTKERGEIVTIDTTNKEFLKRDWTKLTIWTDDGNGSHLEDYYNVLRWGPSGKENVEFGEKYLNLNVKPVSKKLIPAVDTFFIVASSVVAFIAVSTIVRVNATTKKTARDDGGPPLRPYEENARPVQRRKITAARTAP